MNKGLGFLFIVLLMGALAGFLYTQKDYTYGLDVRGGIRLTYSIDTAQLSNEQRQELPVLRNNMVTILQNRATGSLGVAEPTVAYKEPNQFIIELPGATDEKKAQETMSTTASVQWYHARTVVTQKPAGQYRPYVTAGDESDNGRPFVTFARRSDTSKVIKPTLEDGKPNPEYAAIIASWGEPVLQGDDLAKAALQGQNGAYIPAMQFSSRGAAKLEAWSRKVFNQGEMIAAVMDGVVLSIAPIKDNTVLRDNAIIDGTFDTAYVRGLVELLNSGSIPVSLKLEASERVDPTIGNAALEKIVYAGGISFIGIAIFLIAYYSFPGFVALIALLLYMLFTLTVLKWIGATFSLAAIAGFILSVGMAVDANILVFERLKEEMKNGKSLREGVELGFRHALPAIVDSNACTILTSMVLATLGTGPVKGFATTLIIGVAISLFTAITVTRSLLQFFLNTKIGGNPKSYALERSWFGEKREEQGDEKPFKIVEKSKQWIAISIITIIPGLIFMGMGGLKPNVEFRGGVEAQFAVPSSFSQTSEQIIKSLDAGGIEGASVKFGQGKEGQRTLYVTLPPSKEIEDLGAEAPKAIAEKANLGDAQSVGFFKVGPSVQAETVNNAIKGVVYSTLLIAAFLAIRFGFALGGIVMGLRFGLSAILALVHDVLVVLGITAIVGYFAGWDISALFITSMLTVIGFSVHDTIVIFDRIRENLRLPRKGEDFGHLVNRSVTRSFARSLNTSMTVIFTLVVLLVVGTTTPELKLFCVTMLAGIVSGTYSSIFNASPILWIWDNVVRKNKGDEAGIVGVAMQEAAKHRAAASGRIEDVVVDAGGDATRTYGQVKRRAKDQGRRPLD